MNAVLNLQKMNVEVEKKRYHYY
ncbi:class III lanthipeptide [Bacillus paranthracis]